MKTILGIIAFTLTFGLSAGLVGLLFGFPQYEAKSYSHNHYNSAYKYKIKKLLKRDIRNGDVRNRRIYKLEAEGLRSPIYKTEYSDAINEYYEASSSMNDANLPEDFKYAWREHMDAWKAQAIYVKSLQGEAVEDELDTAVRNYADNTREINETWYQVLRIAERYGLDIDGSYYQ